MVLITLTCCAGLFFFAMIVYLALPRTPQMRRKQALASEIPGPPTIPIFGNLASFAFAADMKDAWEIINEMTSSGNGIHRIWFGPILAVVVDEPKNALVVGTSSKTENKHSLYNFFSFAKGGIFVTPDSRGKRYERLRKALRPTWHPKNIANSHKLVATKTLQAINIMETMEAKGEFDVSKLTLAFSLDITCKVILGAGVNEMENNKFNFNQYLKKASVVSLKRVVKPQFYYFDHIFKMTPTGKEFEENCLGTTALLRNILEKRMKHLEARGIDLKSDFEVENFMDTIIKIGCEQSLSQEEMARISCDIALAGSETTGTVSAFALLYLAMHPRYQQEAYEEQVAVVGDSLRVPTLEELRRMPFLSWIQKEVLRLQGVPMIARYSEDEMELGIESFRGKLLVKRIPRGYFYHAKGGYTVPEETAYIIALHKIHRNPEFYEKPDEFYPHHFSPEHVARRPKSSYAPFGFGRRRCPGRHFSYIMFATLLSVLLRRYKFTTSRRYSEMEFKYHLMLESSFGYPIQIMRRDE